MAKWASFAGPFRHTNRRFWRIVYLLLEQNLGHAAAINLGVAIARAPLIAYSRFQLSHPLRFHSSQGNRIDEVAHYRRFRERPDAPPAADGLKILLVGELAYNPERVLALEERGHRLYGLWTDAPGWFTELAQRALLPPGAARLV